MKLMSIMYKNILGICTKIAFFLEYFYKTASAVSLYWMLNPNP